MTLPKAVDLLREIFALESDLFSLPVQIQSLFTSMSSQLTPEMMAPLHGRLSALGVSLHQIEAARDQLRQLLQSEQGLLALETAIQSGSAPIENLKNLIQQLFPPNPQMEHPMRAGIKQLILWFQSVMMAWNQLKSNESIK